jgi:phosphoesterase RecJ-like protein
MNVPQELISFLDSYSVFYIIGHAEPDGDCLGSQTALASFLGRQGKTALLCSPGPFVRSETMAMEPLFSKSISEAAAKAGQPAKEKSAVIILDCSTPERIGGNFTDEIKQYPCAVIDHHASGMPFGDIAFVDGSSPSTTILVYKLIKELGGKPDSKESEDLLFGFLTDTGYFRHLDSSNSESLALAAELLAGGASLKDLYFRMYGGRNLESKILTGIVLSRPEPLFNGKCILIHETLEEKRRFGPESRDSDTIYSQLFGVKGCEAVIFIREESEDTCSVSLRSLNKVDVGSVAKSFGGGGHKHAAGLEWKGERLEITGKLLEVFAEIFKT